MLSEGKALFGEGRYTEALECFAKATMMPEYSEDAMVGVARCYYRKEEFLPAYERFEELAQKGIRTNYAKEMMATINAQEGEFEKAIKIFKKLPEKNNNFLRLSLTYYLQYIHDKVGRAIYISKKTLDQVRINEIPGDSVWRIYLSYGMIFQAQEKYVLAEEKYQEALNSTKIKFEVASVLDEYGSLYISLGRYGEAEKILLEANHSLDGTWSIEEGLNCKWLGILYSKEENYQGYIKAKEYLSKASKLLKEKRIFKELARVNFLLLDLNKKILKLPGGRKKHEAFLNCLDAYAEGIYCNQKSKEAKEKNEKVFDIIINGIDDNRAEG